MNKLAIRSVIFPFVIMGVMFFSCDKTGYGELKAFQNFSIDGEQALNYAKQFYELGPKPYRSSALQNAALWIQEHAKKETNQVRETCGPDQNVRNVEVKFQGHNSKDFVIIGTHFDTKVLFSCPNFAGANDSASGVGAQLAMIQKVAELVQKYELPCELRFLFFDGEECLYEYSATDGLHGSRSYVKELISKDELKNCLGMILLDMIGDKDLHISIPANGNDILKKQAVKIAEQKMNKKGLVSLSDGNVLDDHYPFWMAKVPAIDLIDFQYGPQNKFWHTEEDTLDKLSAESLHDAANLAFQLYLFLATNKLL